MTKVSVGDIECEANLNECKKSVKNFAVLALGFLGDTLLIEPMIRNIKENYPDSNIILIVNKVFEQTGKGFKDVDYIYGYDKKKAHRGVFGYLKFAKDFDFRNKIDCAIITHPHERSVLISMVIGAKNIYSTPLKGNSLLSLFINKKRKYTNFELRNTYKADWHLGYLRDFCQNIKSYDVDFDIKKENVDLDKFNLPKDYIALSPTSKDLIKDWNYADIKEFVKNSSLPVALVGTAKANEISQKLKSDGINFIDLTNKTTILELASAIDCAKCCVSVDTGTFHLAYALKTKTVGIFYNSVFFEEWSPKNLNFVKVLLGERVLLNKGFDTKVKVDYKDALEAVMEIINEK